jgi:hypothetical protein
MQDLSAVSETARNLTAARFQLIQTYLEERRFLQLVAADANLSFRTPKDGKYVFDPQNWLLKCAGADYRPLARFLPEAGRDEQLSLLQVVPEESRFRLVRRETGFRNASVFFKLWSLLL